MNSNRKVITQRGRLHLNTKRQFRKLSDSWPGVLGPILAESFILSCSLELSITHQGPLKALGGVGTKSLGTSELRVLGERPVTPDTWGLMALSRAAPQHLARYVEQYVGTEGASSSPTEGFLLKPVFLQR